MGRVSGLRSTKALPHSGLASPTVDPLRRLVGMSTRRPGGDSTDRVETQTARVPRSFENSLQ